MINAEDREYAGVCTSIIMGALILREGTTALQPDRIVMAAGMASQVIAAVDRHVNPKSKGRPKGRRRQ